MANPLNDPWNQNFATFKTGYTNALPANTGFAVFNVTDLRELTNQIPGASFIVIYSIFTPGTPGDRKTVAIATDINGNRLTIPSPIPEYKYPDHNCPPDCEGAGLRDKVNLRYPGSTN